MVKTNSWQVKTRSCFCSLLRSLGTHLADFFTSPRSSWRILNIVPVEASWMEARSWPETWQPFETSAAAATIMSAVLLFFSAEVALIVGEFPSFNHPNYAVNRRQSQSQCLVPESDVNGNFDFCGAFTTSGEACSKVPQFHIAAAGRGGVNRPSVVPSSSTQPAPGEKYLL